MKRVRDPDALRAAMTARDVTFREVAAVARCHVGTITFALRGIALDAAVARRIARFLRCPVDDLFLSIASNDEQSIDQRKAAG